MNLIVLEPASCLRMAVVVFQQFSLPALVVAE